MGRHIIIESDELYHYGVKGMKWKDHVYATVEKAGNAVRTSAAKVTGATSAFAKKFGQNARKITRSAKAKVRSKVQEAKRKQYARDKSRVAKADEYDKMYGQLGTKSAKKTFKKSVINRIRDNAAKKRLAKQQQVANSNRVSEAKRNRQSELRNQAALNKGTSKAQNKAQIRQNQRVHNYSNRVAGQEQVKSYSSVDSRSSGRSSVDKRVSKGNATRNAITSATINKGASADMSGRSGPSMNTLSSKHNSAMRSIITSDTAKRKKKAKTY